MTSQVGLIAKAVQEIVTLFRTYLATRQETYERKMDKNLRRSLGHAANAFRRLNELDVKVEDKTYLKSKRFFYKYRNKV